jgi:hypothetical protein
MQAKCAQQGESSHNKTQPAQTNAVICIIVLTGLLGLYAVRYTAQASASKLKSLGNSWLHFNQWTATRARLREWADTGYALAVPAAAPVVATPEWLLLKRQFRWPLPPVLSPKAKSWFPPGADPSPAPVAATIRDLPGDLRDAGWAAPLLGHPLPFLASVAAAGSTLRVRSDRRHELYKEVWSYCAFMVRKRRWAPPSLGGPLDGVPRAGGSVSRLNTGSNSRLR